MARPKFILEPIFLLALILTISCFSQAAIPKLLSTKKFNLPSTVDYDDFGGMDSTDSSADDVDEPSDLDYASRIFLPTVNIPKKRYYYRGHRPTHRQWTNPSQTWIHRRSSIGRPNPKRITARSPQEQALIEQFLARIRKRTLDENAAKKRRLEEILNKKRFHQPIVAKPNRGGIMFRRYNAALHTRHRNMAPGKPCGGPLHYVLSATYAATCSCRQATGLHNGVCYSMIPNGHGSCVSRKCRTEFVCDESGSAPWTCMRREVKFRAVPVGVGRCILKKVKKFIYIPYARKT